jgi:hypothetical protein
MLRRDGPYKYVRVLEDGASRTAKVLWHITCELILVDLDLMQVCLP